MKGHQRPPWLSNPNDLGRLGASLKAHFLQPHEHSSVVNNLKFYKNNSKVETCIRKETFLLGAGKPCIFLWADKSTPRNACISYDSYDMKWHEASSEESNQPVTLASIASLAYRERGNDSTFCFVLAGSKLGTGWKVKSRTVNSLSSLTHHRSHILLVE